MADLAISFLVSRITERLAEFLINESVALSEVVSQVEWIERELRLMQAFLEHVERRGQGQEVGGFNEWAEKLKDVARDAEDAIETFIIKSVKRRRGGILSWVDRYKVGKELDRISERMRDISQTLPDQPNIRVVVETPAAAEPSASNAVVLAAPAVQKLSYILSEKLVTSHEVIKMVEQVRDEVAVLHNIVLDLEPAEESSEREKVWLEEVTRVCNFTEDVAGDFISRGRRWLMLGWFKYACEIKLKNEMKYIRTLIGDALHRKVTYGVGVEDVGDRIKSRSKVLQRLSLKKLILLKLPFFIFYIAISMVMPIGQLAYLAFTGILVLCLLILLLLIKRKSIVRRWKAEKDKKKKFMKLVVETIIDVSIDFVIFIMSLYVPLWVALVLEFSSIIYEVLIWTVSLWRSIDKNLKSIQRDLELMRALFSDIEFAEGMNERQKVWVDQLKVVAQHVQGLPYQNRKRGVFSRLKLGGQIIGVMKEIGDVTARKVIYGIANMEGRKGLVPLSQSTQDGGSDNSGIEEQPHAPAPAASMQDNYHVQEYRPVTGLKKEVESIQGEKQLMDALLKDVQEMGELNGRSKVWVEQMRGIAVETTSVINDYASKLEHKPIYIHILKFWTRYVIERKINWIKSKIQDTSRSRKAYGMVQIQTRAESFSMVQTLRRRTQPSLIVKESSIVGFDDDVEALMAHLLSSEERRCVTSVVGIGGTGKTTLAKLIFDNNAVIDHFDHRVWVSLSQDYSIELLPQDMAKEIMGVQEVKCAAEDLTQILKTFLANKRYLIVIDNVQTPQVWDSLKKAIPDMSTGCRLLLTSRSPTVVLNAGPRTFVHHLQLLDDQDSWVLFRRNLKVDIPSTLMKVGEDIVIKCGGLPSEILKMAELLSHKDVTYEEWSSVLKHLNEDQKPWLETLDTINMNLPQYLRRCLFYFVLFPAEFNIPARRLVVLWVAEGLVYRGDNEEYPELVAAGYLTELIDLNMVQISKRKPNGKVKTCRLPYALRELWLTKAKESKFLLHGHTGMNSDSSPKTSFIRRVVDHLDENDISYDHIHGDNRSNSTSLRTYYKNVLSFLSFDAQEGSKPGEEIGTFLYYCISSNCFLQLRVLDLEHVFKPQLPKNISRLSQLRYLGLRWTYSDSLPSSISNLLKLQTLDLKHTYIKTLPGSIWKMQLRHLYLSETYRSRFPPRPKGNPLPDLQTLLGLFVDEESPVKGGLDRLVNIRKLGLSCQSMSLQHDAMNSQLDAVADWIDRLEHLQSLMLKSRDENGQPWNLHLKPLEIHTNLTDLYLLGSLSSSSILSQFPPSLIELTLSHTKLQEDPMEILNYLPDLRSLSLLSESYMGNSVHCVSGSFPQLRVLKIWKLEQLEKWAIEDGALPCLRQLEIRSCRCLKILPDGLQHVKTVVELKLPNMPMELKGRTRDTNSEDWHKISHIPNVFIDDSH